MGVTSLKSVEPCPSRSAGIWLNSCMELCAKNQLPKSKGIQELSSSDENQVDLHRTDPEAQQSQHTRWCSPVQCTNTASLPAASHITALVRSRLPSLTRALFIQLIKIMLVGYFFSDNDLVLVMAVKPGEGRRHLKCKGVKYLFFWCKIHLLGLS